MLYITEGKLMGNACDCEQCCQRKVAFEIDYPTCEYKSYIFY